MTPGLHQHYYQKKKKFVVNWNLGGFRLFGSGRPRWESYGFNLMMNRREGALAPHASTMPSLGWR